MLMVESGFSISSMSPWTYNGAVFLINCSIWFHTLFHMTEKSFWTTKQRFG
jgi:hypothetical protein